MAFPGKLSVVSLPLWEIAVYWFLSLSSHLYSFYELHRFSKEHEEGLDREFQLERGFLIWAFKKDSTDFEWSFWSDWAKRSLLWSLMGHAAVSQLARVFLPQCRFAVLTLYGVLAAYSVLSIKGVAVLMVQLSLSLAVAHLRSPILCWCSSLLMLSTLHFSSLQDIQRGWYDSDERYYLLLFSVALCGLRCISFSLELCWSQSSDRQQCCPPQAGGFLRQLYSLAAYCFYHPAFYNGPVLTYRDFRQQMLRPVASVGGAAAWCVLTGVGRVFAWWCLAETLIHCMHMHAIQNNETYLEMLPPWALGGLALALVQFFYVKYLVLFGVPCLLIRLDGLDPPELPRCVSIMYSFTGMWRHFDVGLYKWLIRYIYIPLGGSRHGRFWKVLSIALAFGFVCFWHGGHDYLQLWAVLNWAGVLAENGLGALLSSPPLRRLAERFLSPPMRRRGLAFISAFSTSMLILSNLIFLGGIHVGRVFWKRVFIQGWSNIGAPMIGFLYCFAQVGLEWDREAP
ncbi:protein-cysteine N-palmitoyltransferase HHAT [Denticeps clupeoides]|uniref:Protein-cysteine N-palmitoyltransferase HHAT n=1 Tax=Denticeps clupeoides TaxID=299321 RepID=A0AAY4BWV8_9TELE|nr:protein-cysteine N-palmitoyltransferase HHAT [Denticeps clupeoides]